jgi:hypothetical protein
MRHGAHRSQSRPISVISLGTQPRVGQPSPWRGLITRRSQVRIPPPLLLGDSARVFCHSDSSSGRASWQSPHIAGNRRPGRAGAAGQMQLNRPHRALEFQETGRVGSEIHRPPQCNRSRGLGACLAGGNKPSRAGSPAPSRAPRRSASSSVPSQRIDLGVFVPFPRSP